jgi:COPII coat assembly protein SEC16
MAVRAALVPRLDMSSGTSASDMANSTPVLGFSAADMHSSIPDLSSASYPGLSLHPSVSHETPVAISTLRPSALDKIQEFLLRGERQKAYHFALDEKLWAHAMVIASSIDKEAWKEVVNEFLKTELGVIHAPGQLNGTEVALKPNGRESLRVAYSMFSGQGAAAGWLFVRASGIKNLLCRSPGVGPTKSVVQSDRWPPSTTLISHDTYLPQFFSCSSTSSNQYPT